MREYDTDCDSLAYRAVIVLAGEATQYCYVY